MNNDNQSITFLARFIHFAEAFHIAFDNLRQSILTFAKPFFSLEDSGDLETTTTFLARRKFLTIGWFNLFFTTLCYLTYPTHPTMLERANFITMLLYTLCLIVWIIPVKGNTDILFHGLVYISYGYGTALCISVTDPELAIIKVSFFFIAFCFLYGNHSFSLGVSVTAFTAAFEAVMCKLQEARVRTAFTLMIQCTLIFVLMEMSNRILTFHVVRYFKSKDDATTEARSKTMLVASISHDLKNPLNCLLGCIDQLHESPVLSESEKKELKTASYSGQILSYLISNILDMSKIQAGKFEVEKLPMSIKVESGKILRIERELSRKKGISLYKKFSTPMPKFVYGDAMRYAEVLINFIGNAIKFTSRGYVAVVFSWCKNSKEVDELNSSTDVIPLEGFFNVKLRRKSKFAEESKTTMNEEDDDVNEDIKDPASTKMPRYRNSSKKSGFGRCNSAVNSCTLPQYRNLSHNINGVNSADESNSLILDSHAKQVKQVIIKLPEGAQEADTFVYDQDDGILVIDIIDTGLGMTKEEKERLFKPFSQANRSYRIKEKARDSA